MNLFFLFFVFGEEILDRCPLYRPTSSYKSFFSLIERSLFTTSLQICSRPMYYSQVHTYTCYTQIRILKSLKSQLYIRTFRSFFVLLFISFNSIFITRLHEGEKKARRLNPQFKNLPQPTITKVSFIRMENILDECNDENVQRLCR